MSFASAKVAFSVDDSKFFAKIIKGNDYTTTYFLFLFAI